MATEYSPLQVTVPVTLVWSEWLTHFQRPGKLSHLATATPKWKSPHQVLLSALTAVELQGITSWVHLSGIKPVSTDMLQEPEDPLSSHPCEFALPLSLPGIWRTQDSLKIPGGWVNLTKNWSSSSERTKRLLLSTRSHLSSFLPPSTSIHLQNNWYALVNLGNYCLACSHLCSRNLLNSSAHAEWFKYDPTVKLLIALAFLHFFPLSTGWIDNSQTPVSSTQNAGSIIDHSDPLVQSVRNFSQVPEGKWSSTRDSRFRMVLYRVRIFYFPVEENFNVSCLTLPLATEEY